MSGNLRFLARVLDAIEQHEARLLVWNLVDGQLTFRELERIIEPQLDLALESGFEDYTSTAQVITALKQKGLLFEITSNRQSTGYRSRMAEAIRLTYRLRQLLPRHGSGNGWQNAPTLVADFRFMWRRRQYPSRNISIGDALTTIQQRVDSPSLTEPLRLFLEERNAGNFQFAEFQVRAIGRILQGIHQRRLLGTVVSAGTGSGKTLAFYLPALATIARHLRGPESKNWVKVVAIYPRTELLKDQFGEVLKEVRRLNSVLRSEGRAVAKIGAFFGETPETSNSVYWPTNANGHVCTLFRCPQANCNGTLVWNTVDLQAKREVLVCETCQSRITDDEVIITRRRMAASPPDILFTTTETLNQRLSDSDYRHLFGVGPRVVRAPDLVLLDEIHTYSGTFGAQVAYLLRRWRHLSNSSPAFVGLSATLPDAAPFFSALTGLRESAVENIAPRDSDLESEGAEYFLVLRGDPVSRTALLSTSIQVAMIVSRILDTGRTPRSGGLYGTRVFVFTDDLDVTNRLYFDLLSAEGRTSDRRPDVRTRPNGGLAVLRRRGPSDLRYQYGQDWRAWEEIGHDLAHRMMIGRVSSQDRGVDSDAEIVVATAALEVGFDDPTVGAVVQHKSPHEAAQFLQRKGRAGRQRGMRPWTVVVLSDYGRDRLAYQAYDLLFNPELGVSKLPLTNRYVQRIQAVYSLIDYLGVQLENFRPTGSVWRDLSRPTPEDVERARQSAIIQLMVDLLESEEKLDRFCRYLAQSLNINDAAVPALLWEFPRPLLTSVVPTAIRRLSTNWRYFDKDRQDVSVQNSPLPEFAPNSLFSDINLSEVSITLPGAQFGGGRTEGMPLFQTLREFAPGRVSRRFGVLHRRERYWIAPPLTADPQQSLEIDTFFGAVFWGNYQIAENGVLREIPVYRPHDIRPVQPPNNISDSSNSRVDWQTQILYTATGLSLRTPPRSPWSTLITDVSFHSHALHSPVEIRRFVTSANAELRFVDGSAERKQFVFRKDGEPAALGNSLTVDGVSFKLRVPENLYAALSHSSAKCRALRRIRFFEMAWTGEALTFIDNPFLRDWLAQIYFSALSYDSISRNVSLQQADEALRAGTASIGLSDVLATLFQSPVIDQSNAPPATQDKLRHDILDQLSQGTVLQGLHELGRILWEPIDADWDPWLRRVFKATVAAALSQAISNLCPEIDAEGLVVDLELGPQNVEAPDEDIWITELAPGGNGLLEAFQERYAADPRRFFSLASVALAAGELETTDHHLTRVLELLVIGHDDQIVIAMDRFRSARGISEMAFAFADLRKSLAARGFVLFHGFLSALSNRILKPGSSGSTDAFLGRSLQTWQQEEVRLGVELDLRVVAYALSQTDAIDRVVEDSGITLLDQELSVWRFNTIYGFLWPRGSAIRQTSLNLYNPFSASPPTERLLVADYLLEEGSRIHVDTPNLAEILLSALATHSFITVVCPEESKSKLADVLNLLATNPIESEYVRVYARLHGLRQNGRDVEASIEVPEIAQ
jgi:hypothetical protein